MSAIFTDLFRGIGVSTEVCPDAKGVIEQVLREKFDAVVLDFDCIADESLVVESLRKSPASRNAVLLAVASDDPAKARARVHGVRFVLVRPLLPSQIARVLRLAYGFMQEDRRRYFRVSVALDVSVRPRGRDHLQCRTMNVSRDGMAVNTPSPLAVGEILDVVFAIPTPGPVVIAQAAVIWDDRHGKAGFHLDFPNFATRERISEWLDSEFHSLLVRRGRLASNPGRKPEEKRSPMRLSRVKCSEYF